jgi:inorganic phosphate transporter, PiT family
MHDHSLILILIVGVAFLYDFVNGFHDAANAIATTIATHALSPRNAILLARTLNFVGGLLHTAVAYTIGKGVINSEIVTLPMLLAALMGAVIWGYFTWYFGLPSSSTYALMGGMIGVALFASNFNPQILIMKGITKNLVVLVVSPFVGMFAGLLLIILFSWIAYPFSHRITSGVYKKLQILSASLMAISHGMNDAQHTMGIITIALLSSGVINAFHVPLWVRLSSAFMMGLGTSVGGWRIIKTMGHKMTNLHEPIDGCAAETAAGAVIMTAAMGGAVVSTTQVITGSIAGTGLAKGFGNVNWRVLGNIVIAWILTLPGAALFGVISYLVVIRIFPH